jgi:hypothetical protein
MFARNLAIARGPAVTHRRGMSGRLARARRPAFARSPDTACSPAFALSPDTARQCVAGSFRRQNCIAGNDSKRMGERCGAPAYWKTRNRPHCPERPFFCEMEFRNPLQSRVHYELLCILLPAKRIAGGPHF